MCGLCACGVLSVALLLIISASDVVMFLLCSTYMTFTTIDHGLKYMADYELIFHLIADPEVSESLITDSSDRNMTTK